MNTYTIKNVRGNCICASLQFRAPSFRKQFFSSPRFILETKSVTPILSHISDTNNSLSNHDGVLTKFSMLENS